ncbi:excisionase [Salmonella enterica subsp. enterica serovar Madelia]|nr:excisionase [Salmonella enterica subsp. enterica serovar Madelia]
MSRMIPLLDWANEEFGAQAPSERILKKYAKGKMMIPPAVKVGRYWMVDRNARFVGTLAEPKIPGKRQSKITTDYCRWLLDHVLTKFQFRIYTAS